MTNKNNSLVVQKGFCGIPATYAKKAVSVRNKSKNRIDKICNCGYEVINDAEDDLIGKIRDGVNLWRREKEKNEAEVSRINGLIKNKNYRIEYEHFEKKGLYWILEKKCFLGVEYSWGRIQQGSCDMDRTHRDLIFYSIESVIRFLVKNGLL